MKELPATIRLKCEFCGEFRPLGKDDKYDPPAWICFDCHLTQGKHAKKTFRKLPETINFSLTRDQHDSKTQKSISTAR